MVALAPYRGNLSETRIFYAERPELRREPGFAPTVSASIAIASACRGSTDREPPPDHPFALAIEDTVDLRGFEDAKVTADCAPLCSRLVANAANSWSPYNRRQDGTRKIE